jgi:cytochrome c553
MFFLYACKITARQMLSATIGASAVLLSGLSAADDVSRGKEKAQSCAMCHGANGIAHMPNAPNLAGQPAAYLAEQLKDYRSGKRSNEIMNVIAKPLTDQEIADLAAWYASIRIEAI